MRNAFSLDVTLSHRIELSDGDVYDEIFQDYEARILYTREDMDVVAGTFEFWVANVSLAMNRGVAIVDVADSIEQDKYAYCSALFEPGTASHLRDEVNEQFDYPTGS